jgi:hypothetical protein
VAIDYRLEARTPHPTYVSLPQITFLDFWWRRFLGQKSVRVKCWGLVLKCYELRTRQHEMLNVNVLRPTKHYSLGDNGPWTKVDGNTITKVISS